MANLLEKIYIWLNRPTEPTSLINPVIVSPSNIGVNNIQYNARGQRTRIDYKNGNFTLYEYDDKTFRLVHLVTLRNASTFPNDCPSTPEIGWEGCQVQNLHYTYDPEGNITKIHDESQQGIFFLQRRVEPSNEYTYDATYRLIKAMGREHLGQVDGCPIAHSSDDILRVAKSHPNDGTVMGTYVENYTYDAVGNLVRMEHESLSRPSCPRWSRHYEYMETSLIENGIGTVPSKTSNRLSSTLLEMRITPLLNDILLMHMAI